MRGFPRHINSKEDILHLLESHPEEVREYLRGLIAGRFSWFFSSLLGEADPGIEDATHKVMEVNTGAGATERQQFELREDANARLFQLGFNIIEAEELVNTVQAV